MASSPAANPRRRKRRRDAADADGWPILIGIALVAALAFGVSRPWLPAAPKTSLPRLSMAEARASNAAVPIVVRRRGRAEPFRFTGGPASREQVTECLATAALYEAGDDARGRRAVMQVVLNRVRSPGFPGTVCGVVYEGSRRPTGCQFSFVCDGSFDRRPIHQGWSQARRDARLALRGRIFAAVGTATNYHADWMVPYWRDGMTKVARVGDHLFYAPGLSAAAMPARDGTEG